MTKQQLQELAAYGVRVKLGNIERELRDIFRAFPDEFASATPPVIVKPQTKTGGNDWPAFRVTTPGHRNGNGDSADTKRAKKISASWTPARRAKASRDFKRRNKEMQAARRASLAKKGKATKRKSKSRDGAAPRAWGGAVWQRAHDFLAGQPERQAHLKDILKGSGANTAAAFITAADTHQDVFKRVSQGVYALKRVVRGDETAAAASS